MVIDKITKLNCIRVIKIRVIPIYALCRNEYISLLIYPLNLTRMRDAGTSMIK